MFNDTNMWSKVQFLCLLKNRCDAKITNDYECSCFDVMCMERVTQVALITNVFFLLTARLSAH